MMEMRVMMLEVLNLIYGKSHRFNILHTSQKLLQVALAKI